MSSHIKGQVTAGRVVAFPADTIAKKKLPLPPRIAGIKGLAIYEVCGDSLETSNPQTTIYSGDFVITRPVQTCDEAEQRLCILLLNDSEKVVKRVAGKDGDILTLTSANPDYKPQKVDIHNVEILAVVIGVYRDF